MTAATRVRGPAAWRDLGNILTEPSERGFALRFAVLALALLVVPWAISTIDLPGPARYLVSGSAALIIAVAYWRWPVEALLALAMFVAFYDSTESHIPHIKQVDELSIAFLAPLALLRSWRQWRAWAWWPRDVAVALFVLAALASTLVAGVEPGTALPGLVLVTKAIVFFYIVLVTPFPSWAVGGALRVGVAIGLGVVALGLVESLNPGAFQSFFGLPEYDKSRGEGAVVKSLFAHPALFGFFTTFVALFTFAQYHVTRRWRWLAAGLFLSLGPFLSARRRAILALLSSLMVGFGESLRRVRNPREVARAWLPVLGGLVVIGAIFFSGLANLYAATLENYWGRIPTVGVGEGGTPIIGEGENPQARLALYYGAVLVAADRFPLGGGLGRYGTWMSREHYSELYVQYNLDDVPGLRERRPSAVTDTFWPAILGESGPIGVLGYVGYLASLGFVVWREAGRADGPLLRVLRFGAGMIFAQAIIESLASSMFHSPPRVYLFYLVVGAVAAIAWRRRAAEPEPETA
jgi:hypothetical protein